MDIRPLPLLGRIRVGLTRERLQEVLKAPADFNRAARRQVGVLGRTWKWDRELLGLPADLPPRYVRRHYDITKFTTPKTRRQRRHRARIIRTLRAKGAI